MVIKGRSRSNGVQLANYLLQSKENDRARVLDIRGTAQPDNLLRSLREMSMTSELTKRGKLGLYHAQVNPAIGEDQPMTQEDWLKAADILEQTLGFDGQKRAIILHEKNGRVHGHIVWERYDHDTGKLRSDAKNYEKHDNARAQIEQEFDHQRTPQKKADRGPSDRELLTQLWYKHPDGLDFVEAAQAEGYIIAQGNDRRPFRVLTPDGQSLDLTRVLDKEIRIREVRSKLQPIRADLFTEAEALKQSINDRDRVADQEQPKLGQSENLREISDSQDLAMAMIKRLKKPEPDQKISFSINFSQTLKSPSDMLYSDLLADQQEQLRKATEDHFVARETIKEMQNDHYDPIYYAGEIERLDTAHKHQIEELQAGFEEKKREFLKEAPSLPQKPKAETYSENLQKFSDKQDLAVAMLDEYRQKRAERQEQQNKAQEAKRQAAEQTKKRGEDKSLTDPAAEMLEEYKRRQEQLKKGRGRTRGGPE